MRTPEQIKAEIAALQVELEEVERKPKQINRTKIPVDTRLIPPSNGRKRYMAANGKVTGFPSWEGTGPLDWQYGTTIAPDQPWTVWLGGECPIPDGLEFEVMWRGDSAVDTFECDSEELIWSHKKYDGDIISYRLTGRVLDGWVL